jgi:hypothetical protein
MSMSFDFINFFYTIVLNKKKANIKLTVMLPPEAKISQYISRTSLGLPLESVMSISTVFFS